MFLLLVELGALLLAGLQPLLGAGKLVPQPRVLLAQSTHLGTHRSIYKYLDTGLPSLSLAIGDHSKLTSLASMHHVDACAAAKLVGCSTDLAGSRACATVRIGETASLC